MERDNRFDIARVLCMTYIVAFMHLYAYIHTNVVSAYFIPECAVFCDTCLGLFTFISGYLLGLKYCFTIQGGVWHFYKKRLLRIFPLFLLASLVLLWIGFNDGEATLNGVLCISPFVKPRPMTLWYIPVILWCYLITPLICRKNIAWRMCSALFVIVLALFLWKLIPSIDLRFLFNLFFFLTGLVFAPYFDWKLKKAFVKWITIVLFVLLLVVVHYDELGELLKLCFSGVGVFALLFVCEFMSKLIYKKDNRVAQLIGYISYASMACYMFHRFFFWAGESLWNPTNGSVKWIYMAGVVYPVMIVLSFFIQKGYDLLLDGIRGRKNEQLSKQ